MKTKKNKHMKSYFNKGIWINTKDEENEIKIWCSTFTGKEIIYLNDKIVSTKRIFLTKSQHIFKDDKGTNYELRFGVANVLKADLKCYLYKNNVLIKPLKTVRQKSKNFFLKKSALVIGLILILSGISLILKKVYNIKLDTIYFLPILILILHTFNNRNYTIIVDEKQNVA